MGYDRKVHDIEIMIHGRTIMKFGNGEPNFYKYLNAKYNLYKYREFENDVRITVYNAKEQYERIYAEMKGDVTWFDPVFWSDRDGWRDLVK